MAKTSRAQAAPDAGPSTEGVRLHVVTGKGGTGKTTVAAALAIALATHGRHVLLTEVEGRQGLAQLFDTPPLPYEERKVASAAGGGEVWALAIDPEAALLEYLEMFYNLKRAGGTLKRLGAIDFATTIAPGMRDVLLTGKVMESTRRAKAGGGRVYDAVVLDAPPTGRISRFLNVNTEVAGLAKVGPIKGQADAVMSVIRSPHTMVHLVTILEEMPVQETIDGVAELRASELPVGGVIVNMIRPALLAPEDLERAADGALDAAALAASLRQVGLAGDDAVVAALLAEAADHAGRVELERLEQSELATLDRPGAQLPLLPGVDGGALHQLAELLQPFADELTPPASSADRSPR